MAELEQANTLINSGLVWNYRLYDCEPFSGECLVTQCFKCFSYGHVAKMYQNTLRCGICAALGHTALNCLRSEDRTKFRCIPCSGNYVSWSPECPKRKKRKEAAKAAYNNRPTHFQETTPYGALLAPAPIPVLAPAPTPNPNFEPASTPASTLASISEAPASASASTSALG